MEKVPVECHHCHRTTHMIPVRGRTHSRSCNRCANQKRDQDAGRYIARKLAEQKKDRVKTAPFRLNTLVNDLRKQVPKYKQTISLLSKKCEKQKVVRQRWTAFFAGTQRWPFSC